MCHETLDLYEVHASTPAIKSVVQRSVCAILAAPPAKPRCSSPKPLAPGDPAAAAPSPSQLQPGSRGAGTQGTKLPPLPGLAPGPAGLREPPSPERGPGRAPGQPQSAPKAPRSRPGGRRPRPRRRAARLPAELGEGLEIELPDLLLAQPVAHPLPLQEGLHGAGRASPGRPGCCCCCCSHSASAERRLQI